MHAQFAETHPAPVVAAAIRSLLLEARRSLLRDPAGADRCIEGAVGLLPEGAAVEAATPALAAPTFTKGSLAPWQISRVRALIEARLAERLVTADIAAVTRLSESHFSRAFKRSFGAPPHAYINRRRIARAKSLMLETDEPLAAIALACGLADQAHFCRLFRRFEGQSPSNWRRLHMGASTAVVLVA